MSIAVKFCGLTRPEDITAAHEAAARYVGFVHFAKSPRHLEIDPMAALAVEVLPGLAKVLLTVNADDATLDAITARVPLDMLQLHGGESPDRVGRSAAVPFAMRP